MLNMRRNLIWTVALALAVCLASGVSFAYTTLAEIPPLTEPYSTDRPPWQPPPAPQGDVTFFTTESDFKDACGATTTEDFSCSVAEPGGVCSGPGPVNSSTNDGCFNGCLSEGWEFTAVGIGDYAAIGTGFLGVGIPALGPNYFTDEASFTFSPAVSCAGFKLIGDLVNPVDVDCTWQPSGAVATIHGSLQGVFIGGVGPGITGIDCVEQVDGSGDLYGDLQLGGGGDGDGPPPVPAAGTWGMIALISLLLAGSLYYMRRRVEA
jgi:hypothetical protein